MSTVPEAAEGREHLTIDNRNHTVSPNVKENAEKGMQLLGGYCQG